MKRNITCECGFTYPATEFVCPACKESSPYYEHKEQILKDGACEKCGKDGRRLEYKLGEGKIYKYMCFACFKKESIDNGGVSYAKMKDEFDKACWIEAAAREYLVTIPVFYGKQPDLKKINGIYNKTVHMKWHYVSSKGGNYRDIDPTLIWVEGKEEN